MPEEQEGNSYETEASSQIIEREKKIYKKYENIAALCISVFMLLLLALGLLFYFQFYEGEGNWRFTLKHKANDTAFMAKLTPQLQALQSLNDSLRTLKPDTVTVVETIEVPAPIPDPVIPEQEIEKQEIDVYTPDPDKKFLVQIGAFKKFDLSKFQPGMESMEQHKVNGLNTITIGRFKTQKEAELFAKEITLLGIKSPLISKLENGKPVVIKPKAPAKKKR